MHQMVEKAVQNQRSSEKSENLTVFSMRKPVGSLENSESSIAGRGH